MRTGPAECMTSEVSSEKRERISRVGGGALTSTEVTLRRLGSADLPRVAIVHHLAFPDSALAKLGSEAICRYYEWQLHGPHEVVASGAFMNGECVGFCFSGVFRGATSGFLKRNRTYLVKRVVTHPWLLTNELVRSRLLTSIRILSGTSSKAHGSQTRPT